MFSSLPVDHNRWFTAKGGMLPVQVVKLHPLLILSFAFDQINIFAEITCRFRASGCGSMQFSLLLGNKTMPLCITLFKTTAGIFCKDNR